MLGYLAIILHAHLPFVRHPEHRRSLEELWLFECITETYLPLLQRLEKWTADGIPFGLTMSLSPTLCAMLNDPVLRERYDAHLSDLIVLSQKEVMRTQFDKELHELAVLYCQRFEQTQRSYRAYDCDLVRAFGRIQEQGSLEIITCAATHAVLPLLHHAPSVRAQILTACDDYCECFGRHPRGIWLPECAYSPELDAALQEANIKWFVLDTHGLLHSKPPPLYGTYAPVFTPNAIAAFGRDPESAKQVWSRQEGYPGDFRYRDFYRDVGFELDLSYVEPHLPAPPERSFTGIKYWRVTGPTQEKALYDPKAALEAANNHASHFLQSRREQIRKVAELMHAPPAIISPYDCELFGHWWYEGPDFLDALVRQAATDSELELISPEVYLRRHPTQQVATPSASSWGEEGYWKMWLNENNEWIYRHIRAAQERMSDLARRFPDPDSLQRRALNQAARELLLAQASDWPFIIRTNTSSDYAQGRIKDHLLRFLSLHDQLTMTSLHEDWLAEIEARDRIFPRVNYRYWA